MRTAPDILWNIGGLLLTLQVKFVIMAVYCGVMTEREMIGFS